MTAPIVTGETTLRELGEILGRSALVVSQLSSGAWLVTASAADRVTVERPDLAAAINAALVKAGVR